MAKKLKWKKENNPSNTGYRLVAYASVFETQLTIYDAKLDRRWLAASYWNGCAGMSYHSWGDGAFCPKTKRGDTVDEIKQKVQAAYEKHIEREIKRLQSL